MENSHTWAFNGITECTASYVSDERYYREWLWYSSSTGTVSVVLSRVFLRIDRSAWNRRAQNAVVMGIPENIVKAMPTERIHERSRLLQPGEQCRICLRSYQIGERVRRLACRHKFHIDCIGKNIYDDRYYQIDLVRVADGWLLHSHPTCPIDGQLVWSADMDAEQREVKR